LILMMFDSQSIAASIGSGAKAPVPHSGHDNCVRKRMLLSIFYYTTTNMLEDMAICPVANPCGTQVETLLAP